MSYENTKEILWIERLMKLLSWMVLLTSIVMTWNYGSSFFDRANQIEANLSNQYKVPVEVAGTLKCYKGYLHYPNTGTFSGLIAISPNIQCSEDNFKKDRFNDYTSPFLLSALCLLISIFFIKVFSGQKQTRY